MENPKHWKKLPVLLKPGDKLYSGRKEAYLFPDEINFSANLFGGIFFAFNNVENIENVLYEFEVINEINLSITESKDHKKWDGTIKPFYANDIDKNLSDCLNKISLYKYDKIIFKSKQYLADDQKFSCLTEMVQPISSWFLDF